MGGRLQRFTQLSQAEDVIVPASGETRADIARAACVLDERVALGSDLNILRSDLYGPFLSYLLNSPLRHAIAQLAQGDTVAHLYPKQLLQVWLTYPSPSEQLKIANCLGSLDDLIMAEGRKLEVLRRHKQGLMQQLFPRPGETVPRLRFPDFHKALEWAQTPLGDAFNTITNGKANAQDHQDDGAYPLFDRSEIVKRSSSFLFDTEAVILPGEGMKLQPRHFKGKFNLHQRAYALMEPTLDSRFAFHALDRFKRMLADNAVQSTVLSLRMPIIEKFTIPVPPTEAEQQKIADCLGSLDDLIAAEERKIEVLQQHKQGLMQQIFPSLERQ